MEAIRTELLGLVGSGGLLTAPAVLRFARNNPESAVHAWLCAKGAFSPARAARQFALLMCAQLIRRVRVRVVGPNREPITVRAFTSLAADRLGGAGYRSTEAVLSQAHLRAQMLATARAELESLRRRYAHLLELAAVFAAIDKLPQAGD
jgi:hypothetical protein